MADDVQPTPEDRARYDLAKRELIASLQKKRQLDKTLAQLEVQIFNFEGSYLTDTAVHSGGNIITGLEAYLKNVPAGRKKHDVNDADRVFSNSSRTFRDALEMAGEADESALDDYNQGRGGSQALMTVVVPPARSQDVSSSHRKGRDNKKKRQRGTTISDDESVVSTSRKSNKRSRAADDD